MEPSKSPEKGLVQSRLSCCKPIDSLLSGGFESGVVSTIYGPPGSGKSNICMVAAISCLRKGKKVVFIDTEGNLSVDRFLQLASDDSVLLDNVVLITPSSVDELLSAITSIQSMAVRNLGLVIVDSIAVPYRVELADARSSEVGSSDVFRSLGRMIFRLSRIAAKFAVPVIITSQVYSSFEEEGKLVVIGGDAVKFGSKCMIELSSAHSGLRRASLRKHRSLPVPEHVDFVISENALLLADGIKHSGN